jgi:Leucine-rich repeat (LRR) protein
MWSRILRPFRDATIGYLLLAIVAGTAVRSAGAGIPPAERDALIALYGNTNGAGWTNRTNWRNADGTDFNTPGSECTWFGVTCDAGQTHVVGLALSGNNLSGTVPDLSALAALETLSLARNGFAPAPLPAWLASMPALVTLDFARARVDGTIPDLGALTALEVLRLHNNPGLAAGPVPGWIAELSGLRELSLWSTSRTGPVPAWLASMSQLEYLDLNGNELTGSIPACLGDLTGLTYLNLSWNRLTGPIPPELGALANLTRIDIDGNSLTGTIPESLCSLTKLNSLNLERNPDLSGAIPDCIGNLVLLEILSLGYSSIGGPVPASFSGLTQLKWLWGSNARFTGDLPDLSGATGLQGLTLNDNTGLSPGPVPAWLSSLACLQEVNLSFTNRTGDIPDLSAATGLRLLDLGGNQQMRPGPIPAWLSGMTALHDLELFYTNRTGPIPDLSAAASLSVLSLSGNPQITPGPIPAWLVGRPALTRLGLEATNRTGAIPDLSGSPGLQDLDLGANPGLTAGPIPEWLRGMSSLMSLSLMETNRTGEIPDLSALVQLDNLVLGENPGLTLGPIPAWVGDFPLLTCLVLNATNRTGPIPDLGGRDWGCLGLGDNPSLDGGPIPDWIAGSSGMFLLDLHNSNRSGVIPAGFGGMTNVVGLDLSGNQLSGEVPASLAALTNLGAVSPYLLIDPAWLGLDLRWNAVHSADPSLVAFLDSKQKGGDWQSTQTVPPGGVTAGEITSDSVTVSWTPIAYAGDGGGYRVSHGTSPAGPFAEFGVTGSKSAASLEVTGLLPETTYHFVVETLTQPHASNPHLVVSEPSAVVSASTATVPDDQRIPQAEREALIAFYNATSGAQWANRTGWRNPAGTDFNVPGTECTWFGVTCNASRAHVTRLELAGNGLSGPISGVLGALTRLEVLTLRDNPFQPGPIPEWLKNLPLLRRLDLSGTRLTGALSEFTGLDNRFVSLEYLAVSRNQLSSWWLTFLPPILSTFLADDNDIGYLPDMFLHDQPGLKILNLANNRFSQPFPVNLNRIVTLEELYLQGNRLYGEIPPGFGTLSGLGAGKLDLRWNALEAQDPALRDFLGTRQTGGDWESTQTVPPVLVSTEPLPDCMVRLSWNPITFTGGGGGYVVYQWSTGTGWGRESGKTGPKTAPTIAVRATCGAMSTLSIKTVTEPHANNKNTVTSLESPRFDAMSGPYRPKKSLR